jgi:hypothetical protein
MKCSLQTIFAYLCQLFYDPQTGRFTQLDPQDSPALSPYAYCYENPLKYKDPTGQASARDLIIAELFDLYEKGKEGRRSYLFCDYDQYGNLTGMDYWDPWSANNPYLENFTIPPAEYFTASYGVKYEVPEGVTAKKLTYQQMIAHMRDIYNAAMYGGWRGREMAKSYGGAYVYNVDLPGSIVGEGWHEEYLRELGVDGPRSVLLDMTALGTDFSAFAKTTYHEGCHIGKDWKYYLKNEPMAESFARILYYRTYGYRWWFNY